MKIFSINSVPYGSTAEIMAGIARISHSAGIEHMTSTGYSYHPMKDLPKDNILIGNAADKLCHIVLSKITGLSGCFSYLETMRFIGKIKKFKPDVIHLHNLHCWYINIPLLFRFIKKHRIPVVWTLHDCWAFTGQCPHFTMINCSKWRSGCHHCPQFRDYPGSFVDRTKIMWRLKRSWFTGVDDLTVVTPSQWLAKLVKQSYLKDYPVRIINNGIDLSVFKPSESDFRARYGCEDKMILLGTAFGWGKRKGLDVFVELSKRLDTRYQIVLVGTDENVDRQLPDNIISIRRTQNKTELAEIYTAADLFVNPTREENYPSVNMEALACGTPVLTFRTGGSPEVLDETCGCVVECDDIDAMVNEIKRICRDKPYSEEACLRRALSFDMNDRFKEYIDLYSEITQIKNKKT